MQNIVAKDVKSPSDTLLKEKKDQLIDEFVAGNGEDFFNRYSQLFDDYFYHQFETSRIGPQMGISRNPYAIIALGGYGRREQCIGSDVDLLFLFRKKVPKAAERLIQEIVYPLWDIGFEVGYAIRSLKECIQIAAQDYETLTPLLDARFICGVSQVYMELFSAVRDQLIGKKKNQVIAWLVQRNKERHDHFGDSSYLLEPNLKEGQGGLRDYHTMLWIARVRSNIKEPRDLEFEGYLSDKEYSRLTDAISFIWQVRNLLHHLAKRKCDQLYFEYQIRLAELLDYKTIDGLQPVEQFLGRLHSHMAFLKQQHRMFIEEYGLGKGSRRGRKSTKTSDVKGIKVDNDKLWFTSSKRILQSPELLIEIFRESARLKVPLSAEAKRLVREFRYLANKELRNSPTFVKGFEKILLFSPPTFDVLNDLLSTGFLEKFIPEINSIVDRIQYDDYHLYPVDRHSIRTVETVKTLGASEDLLCATLYHELKSKKLLLWAALLHDIGKGAPGSGHAKIGSELTKRILLEKGFKPEDIDTISFLVQHHLFLIHMATRRDIQEEETAIACAREIKDIERLKMLYLLGVADSMATGPKAWNDWTSTLLRDLFLKVLTTLEGAELASMESVEIIDRKKEDLLASAQGTEISHELEVLFSIMSQRYLLYTATQDIKEHVKLYKRLGDADFVWDIATEYTSDTRQVTICAKDRPGLLSKIAGVFTLNSLNILDVQVYTWRNNIALDIFRVEPPQDLVFEAEKWSRAEKRLTDALCDRLDLGKEVRNRTTVYRPKKPVTLGRPHHVTVDNEVSSFFTIVEVFTYDSPGLLFLVTDALFRCRLDVWVAKIGTKVDQVVDVFYVRDFDGQKVDSPEQVSRIKETILSVLKGPA